MALIAPQKIVSPSLTPVFAAVTASDTVAPGGLLFLHVKNTNAAACNVTIDPPGTLPQGVADPANVVAVPATTGERLIPLLDKYADPVTGLATITYSVTAGVTAAVLSL